MQKVEKHTSISRASINNNGLVLVTYWRESSCIGLAPMGKRVKWVPIEHGQLMPAPGVYTGALE